MRFAGADLVATFKLNDDADFINLTGDSSGVTGIDLNTAEGIEEKPSSGASLLSQLNDYTFASASFAVNDIPRLHSSLLMKSGRRVNMVVNPEGLGAGKPTLTFDAIQAVTMAIPTGSVRRFQVALNIDGAVAATVQA